MLIQITEHEFIVLSEIESVYVFPSKTDGLEIRMKSGRLIKVSSLDKATVLSMLNLEYRYSKIKAGF